MLICFALAVQHLLVELPFLILIYTDYTERLHPCFFSDLCRDGYRTQARPTRALLEPFSETSGKETESFVGIKNCKDTVLEPPTAGFAMTSGEPA